MKTSGYVPRELQEMVERELESGEQIQWMDMPIPRFFTPVALGAFLFAIPWTGFSIFWICGAAGFQWPDLSDGMKGFEFFPLFGFPFVLIGLAMLSSPLWAYKNSLKTVYVVTDRRAITFNPGWGMTVRSYPPAKLHEVYRQERKDGSGDVIIARRAWRDSDGDRQSEELGFLRIRQPKEVELMLNQLAKRDSRGNLG